MNHYPDHSAQPSPLRIYAGVLADALALISACHGLSRAELIAHGLPDTTAKELHELANIYYGDTAYTRMRVDTIQSIRANWHGLPTLLEIERQASRVKGLLDKWKIRQHAAGLSGSARDIGTAARLLVARGTPAPGCLWPGHPRSTVRDPPWAALDPTAKRPAVRALSHARKPAGLKPARLPTLENAPEKLATGKVPQHTCKEGADYERKDYLRGGCGGLWPGGEGEDPQGSVGKNVAADGEAHNRHHHRHRDGDRRAPMQCAQEPEEAEHQADGCGEEEAPGFIGRHAPGR